MTGLSANHASRDSPASGTWTRSSRRKPPTYPKSNIPTHKMIISYLPQKLTTIDRYDAARVRPRSSLYCTLFTIHDEQAGGARLKATEGGSRRKRFADLQDGVNRNKKTREKIKNVKKLNKTRIKKTSKELNKIRSLGQT